jgi:phosphopantetheine adenylyltransferase|tara:strand:+ start:235 stop:429 length:195 start_codon:yes stop_codon:yes gene_type:complete
MEDLENQIARVSKLEKRLEEMEENCASVMKKLEDLEKIHNPIAPTWSVKDTKLSADEVSDWHHL